MSGRCRRHRVGVAAVTGAERTLSSVGVIGGGVAGLACARRLMDLGISATVFDTGKRGPGGRASSRTWRGHLVDHAAQFVTTTDKEFAEAIETSGAARRWGADGRFGVLGKSGFVPASDGVNRWVGIRGMGGIVEALANGIDIRQDVWVPPSKGIRYGADGTWSVTVPKQEGNPCFDAVVIAHNGKCAERLTSKTPAQSVHRLLQTQFAPVLRRKASPGQGKFCLNSIYSLLLELPADVMPNTFDAALVTNQPNLRWLSSNTAKLSPKSDTIGGTEVWTVLSSAEFASQHKVPQEFLEGGPKETEVTNLLLESVEHALGLEVGRLKTDVVATKLQLWGAALPINGWAGIEGADFVWSSAHKIGIAGDWFTPGSSCASTMEAAWLSGTHLAEHMAWPALAEHDVGLTLGEDGGRFVPVNGDFGKGGNTAPAWVRNAKKVA